MISKQDKQAILNGTYGITRKGTKVKYLFTSDVNSEHTRHLFIEYVEQDSKISFHNTLWLTEDFRFYTNSRNEHGLDVVGLWQDKPEPFDLKRALDGESLLDLRNNEKCWLYKSHKNGDLITEYENTHSHLENIEPLKYLRNNLDLSKCFGMWKEPEPEPESKSNTVTLTLPCPLKEPREIMWFINDDFDVAEEELDGHFSEMLIEGRYFATKEDAQAWLDAMKNNRR